MDYTQIAQLLEKLSTARNTLTSLGVIRSQKVIPDFAEWLVAQIFGGSLAPSKTQENWDVKVGTEKVQVKEHAKARDNRNRWS